VVATRKGKDVGCVHGVGRLAHVPEKRESHEKA
jgi:hypothetical protein